VEVSSFTELLNLASDRMGGTVLAASDDFFAEKENLIKAPEPLFVPGKYTDRGKWMDGWESRRKRTPGYDWAIIRLGVPGVIRGIVVDTSFFTGNYPEHCSIEGCNAAGNPRADELQGWAEILPKTGLRGDTRNPFEIASTLRFTHLRFNIFPDGGVARLRVHGIALPDWKRFGNEVDLAAAECGGVIVDSSDRHYGHPLNLIMPGRGLDMSDGWETRRRRGPGHDWVILRLGAEGIIDRIEVDTAHFKGNFPDSCSLEISSNAESESWREVLARARLQAHSRHLFSGGDLSDTGQARFARFNIFPDGGVSRLRLYGRLTETGRMEAGLAVLNASAPEAALRDLQRCCGSSNWAARMTAARPYATIHAMEEAADRVWGNCSREDWLEAFAAHPKIGQRSGSAWSRQEQSAANAATEDTVAALADANRQYEAKFGYIFIVCASGKTAPEMLAILKERLANDPAREIQNAVEQQRLITHLRLRKLLTE
jgi:allantoicase